MSSNEGFGFTYALATTGAVSGVPEPSTWAMMLIGFAGIGFVFRQSRRKVSLSLAPPSARRAYAIATGGNEQY